MSLNRVPYPTGNYSSRGGAPVRLIVLHTAEGARNIADLGAWFANPASGVSSHVGIDDTANTVGEYVRRDYKAWTAANANPVAVQAELCAFADWDAAEWNRHPNMLANTAAWIAEEAKAFAIPIVKLTAGQAQGSGRGVCQHNDLGSWGGGHWDCGPAFPIDAVIALAQGVTPTPPPPALSYLWPGSGGQDEGAHMAVCTHPSGKRMDLVSVNPDGSVNHSWTDSNAAWKYSENLGGTAKSVSCCWLDSNRFVVICHGIPDVPYQRINDNGRWATGWVATPDIKLKP